MSTQEKIEVLLGRLHQQQNNLFEEPSVIPGAAPARPPNRPGNMTFGPVMSRPRNLQFRELRNDNDETDRRLREIMKISGDLTICDKLYKTDIREMDHLEELGNGTCGHVVKMRHRPSDNIIAVKQMRRSGNTEETKRIIMDIEVVLKSHDCKYIVQCLGCFITDSEVWICMELMDTCFDKLLKKVKQPIPEDVLGKVTVATVQALAYLKDKHGVIHRDVKPSNILLDGKGNVKLCDFGISGRLVDSMAKTRQAGCAAYMAPERIEPDPNNPDYDVRADVWSLGITLVELATGVFPYKDCNTDFEMLTKVIDQDPPTLPEDKDFSPEFREFVRCCLIKDKKNRPKYDKLKNHDFIKKYKTTNVNVGEWFVRANQQADAVVADRGAARPNSSSSNNPIRHFFASHFRQPPGAQINGGSPPLVQQLKPDSTPASTTHKSRYMAFHHQREGSLIPHLNHQRTLDHSQSPQRSYSPFLAYQNHLASLQKNEASNSHIPLPQSVASPYLPRRVLQSDSASRYRSPSASPLPLRTQFPVEEQQYNSGNTSPIILQRFYHQQKQQQLAKEAEESGKSPGKKRFSSYIKLQLSGDRSGRNSRHQSPEPPPRLNRTSSGGAETQSPLTLRRNFLETHAPNSPSLSRRYVSPTPPVPPPRRLSESTSVPGSPQHLRTRFHYTPEPQRRLFHNNDIS